MRAIPSSLLSKIQSSMQTSHNNANPQLDIIVQQSNQFLSEGLALNPYTIRTGEALGPLDIAVRREIANEPPQELMMVYIEGGIAKLATLDITDHVGRGWKYLYDIGPAIDCAIDFDGRWHRVTSFDDLYFFTTSRWALTTFGEPYIALVKSDGTLTVQLGQGTPVTLSTGVSAVSMLRGWKNTAMWNHDQGMIVAYLKSGVVNYRNYAQQPPDQPAIWEIERVVTELPTPADTISLFRTNDYRTGFLCESEGQIHWALTSRNWATMAVEDHTVSATITNVLVTLTALTYADAFSPDHTVSATISGVSIAMCPEVIPQIIATDYIDEYTITLLCDVDLAGDLTGLQSAFTAIDEALVSYPVSATAKDNKTIILTTANFSGATGDITVTHTGSGIYHIVEGGCFMYLPNFQTAFTPDFTPPPDPSLYSPHHTITAGITGAIVDLKVVTYTDVPTDHTISATITGVTVTLIHVEDINP